MRVRGATGDVIDIVALVGTVFGVATSMGIGVVLLNVGFSWLFGLPQGLGLQIALVLVAVVMTIAACTSGVDKGIRIISELNLWSTAAMMVYILVTGQTAFLLNALLLGVLAGLGAVRGTLPGPHLPWPHAARVRARGDHRTRPLRLHRRVDLRQLRPGPRVRG